MNQDIVATPLIDPNHSSYGKFFDHPWSGRMFEATKQTPLEEPVNELILSWRSTNGVHVLPWLLVQSLKSFAQGEIEGNLLHRESYGAKFIKGVTTKIEKMMQYSLKLDQQRALRRSVSRLEAEAHHAIEAARDQPAIDADGFWDYLVSKSEFHFCLLGIQRNNYGSLFFAYEDFLANVIRTKDPTYSSKGPKNALHNVFPDHFGAPLSDYCWNHDEVTLARLVRNALVHNGARFGNELQKFATRFVDVTGTETPELRGDQFNLVRGTIQIMPDNTALLFSVLKERVTKIVEELV